MKSTFQLCLLLLTLVSLNVAAQQSCNLNIVETAPASRFTIDVDGGTVTDTQTSLIWARCPQGLSGEDCTPVVGQQADFTWTQALNLNGTSPTSVTAGPTSGTDWRLPNIKELQSLVERRCRIPAINAMVFPNTGTGSAFFWSASPNTNFPNTAWRVDFVNGGVALNLRTTIDLRVRLVRGGTAQ